MYFFGFTPFIFVLIVVYVLFRQNSRIKNLENIVSEKLKQNKSIDTTNQEVNKTEQTVSANQNNNSQKQEMQTATASSAVSQTAGSADNDFIKPKKDEEFSGRFLGKLGIGAVLVGVSFFLKYAFDNNWIGPTGRVMLGIIVGLGFIVLGQYLRKKYVGYSDLLMGGGSAILYLSIYSAYGFYSLISASTTGILMLCVTALTFVISIVNATMILSLVGVIGGFVTPFLVNTRADNMLVLFMYMTLINLGVLGISFFKKWPKLNVASFIGTFINFSFWYSNFYTPKVLGITMLFLFVSFLIFLIASVARGITAGIKADQADYLLMGANALVFAGMCYVILEPLYDHVLGFGSVFIAIVYIVVAFMVNRANPEDRALNIFIPGLAVTFLSIAVPLQFSGPWIAVAWLIESVVLYIIASMINNRGFQVMGVIVYCLGIVDYLIWSSGQYLKPNFVPIFNSSFAVLVLAVISAYTIAYMYKKFGSITVEIQNRGIMVFIVIANIISIYAISSQIIDYHKEKIRVLSETFKSRSTEAQRYNTGYDNSQINNELNTKYYSDISKARNQSNTLVSIFWTLYAAALTALGFARRISSLRRLGLILFIITALKVIVDIWSLGQLYRIISLVGFGLIALIASFAYAKYKDRLKEIV